MPNRNHKNKPPRGLLILMVLTVFSLLGACNNQGGEVVMDIAEEAKMTEPAENSDAKTQEQEQEAAPPAELTAQPTGKVRFAGFEPVGEVSQKLLTGLEEVEGIFKDRLLTAIEEEGLSESEASVQIIEREDKAGNVWHNAIIGIPASPESGYLDRLWLYVEVDEAETQYVLPGEGIEGGLIPIGVSYVVDGESVGMSLPEGNLPEGVLYRLGNGEQDNFQGTREFIYFDLQENEVLFSDPWTGKKYQLDEKASRGLLAKIVPAETEIFPGLPVEKAREILDQGLLPDQTSKGEWVAVNQESEIVRLWNSENEGWQETELIVTRETYENINRWLEGEEFDYTKKDLFRNPENMSEKYPVGYYTFSELRLGENDYAESKTVVQLQGVLLGFGRQETSMIYDGIDLSFRQKGIFLGLENMQSGERIAVPFPYNFVGPFGVPDEKEELNQVYDDDSFPIYWHVSHAPIWGDSVLRTEAYDVEKFPQELSHVMGKPISIGFQAEIWPEGLTAEQAAAIQGIDLDQFSVERVMRSRLRLAIAKEFGIDDYGLLDWLRYGGGETQFIEGAFNLSHEPKFVGLHMRLFAPEEEK